MSPTSCMELLRPIMEVWTLLHSTSNAVASWDRCMMDDSNRIGCLSRLGAMVKPRPSPLTRGKSLLEGWMGKGRHLPGTERNMAATVVRTPLALYRHLLRRLEALPVAARDHYKHRIRQVCTTKETQSVSIYNVYLHSGVQDLFWRVWPSENTRDYGRGIKGCGVDYFSGIKLNKFANVFLKWCPMCSTQIHPQDDDVTNSSVKLTLFVCVCIAIIITSLHCGGNSYVRSVSIELHAFINNNNYYLHIFMGLLWNIKIIIS